MKTNGRSKITRYQVHRRIYANKLALEIGKLRKKRIAEIANK